MLNQVLIEPTFDLRYRSHLTFSTSLIGLNAQYNDNATTGRVKETYLGISLGDFDFTAGRMLVRWGTGYAFTAAGVLDPPRNPANPTDRLNINQGRDMIKADWVRGHHALTFAWSTAALAPAHSTQTDTTAFRYNVLVRGFDTSLIAGDDHGSDAFGGLTFTRVIGQAWELHGEEMWRDGDAALIGAKYTMHSGVTFLGEFYTPPNIPYLPPRLRLTLRRPPVLRILQLRQVSPARTSGMERVGCLRFHRRESQRPQFHCRKRHQSLVRQPLHRVCPSRGPVRHQYL